MIESEFPPATVYADNTEIRRLRVCANLKN